MFIANISNAVVHQVLEKSIEEYYLRKKYNHEFINSLNVSKRYRDKINPANTKFAENDKEEIRKKIKNNTLNELKIRINKGYKEINIGLIDNVIDNILKELKV